MGGFGMSTSDSRSQSSNYSIGSSFIDSNQQPFLDFLRNMGMGSFGGFQQGQGVFSRGMGQLGQQAGQFGQAGMSNPFINQLQQQAGGNPDMVQAQTQQLGQDIGQFFNQQILPGISSQAAGGGQLGGGRQGVAQGMAAQSAANEFQRGALGFQTADNQRAQQAGIAGGQLFGQGVNQGLQGLGLQSQFMGNQFESQFAPLQFLQQLFGDPTVLSRQSSHGQSTSSSSSLAMSGG